MNLDDLLQAMNLAVAEAAKDTENTDLATKAASATKAYNDAKAASEADPDKLDESKFDEKTKAYLAKLRKENATHRTANKDLKSKYQSEVDRSKAILKAAGIEVETDKPEEQIKNLTAQSQQQALRNAVLETAISHGVPGDKLKYFEFLITSAVQELDEGDELSDEALEAIVIEVKKGVSKSANSTVGDGKKPNPNSSPTETTFEQFLAMGPVARSTFYLKNQDKYVAFVSEAKAKKKSLV